MKKENSWETKEIEGKERSNADAKKSWLSKEGELAVDVYSTEEDIIIQAPIAGVKREDLEIITEKDMVVIKGKRGRSEEKIDKFYTKECFYGDFCREIILPEETDPSRIEANIEQGILTIKAPKIDREKKRKIDI